MSLIKLVPFADYHTHTTYSHGSGSIEDNVLAARQWGLEILGIADHGPANPFIGVKSAATFREMKAEISRLNRKYRDIKVILGVEANIISREGDLDISGEILSMLDMLLVGLHPLVIPKNVSEGIYLFGSIALSHHSSYFTKTARHYATKAVLNALERYAIDVITHPGLHVPVDTPMLARAARERGTALEINASHPEEAAEFVRAAYKYGVKFSLGSDAHSPDDVGHLEPALRIVERFNIPAESIINCRSLAGEVR